MTYIHMQKQIVIPCVYVFLLKNHALCIHNHVYVSRIMNLTDP